MDLRNLQKKVVFTFVFCFQCFLVVGIIKGTLEIPKF